MSLTKRMLEDLEDKYPDEKNQKLIDQQKRDDDLIESYIDNCIEERWFE